MNEVDRFSSALLEEAKRFLEKAKETTGGHGAQAYLHASLALGFASLEAHLNSIADDFTTREDLPLLERGILLQRDIELDKGTFSLSGRLRMYSLEDRVEFLHRKFSGVAVDKSCGWWSKLKAGLKLRNQLIHPRGEPEITSDVVADTLQGILETLDVLFRAVYKKPHPASRRGLASRLDF